MLPSTQQHIEFTDVCSLPSAGRVFGERVTCIAYAGIPVAGP